MASEILSYWRIIGKRWWLITLIFVVTNSVILANALRAKPVYKAYVKLQVIAPESQYVSLFSEARATSSRDEIIAVEVQFDAALRSPYVAWQTIADLNLGISAAELLEGLTVVAEEEFLHVTFVADNPMLVEAIATAHVENAFKYYAQIRAKSATVALQFIQQQLAEEEKALSTAQNALLEFKLKHNIDSLPREIQAIQDALRELRLERAKLVVEREAAQAKADEYRAEVAKSDSQKAGVNYAALAFNEAVSVASILAREAEYDKLIAQQEVKLEELLKLTLEYDQLVRNVVRIQSNYNFLADKENEARLKQSQANNVSFIQIVEPARMPDRPVPSQTPKMLAVGSIVSVISGIILAFILEFISTLFSGTHEETS